MTYLEFCAWLFIIGNRMQIQENEMFISLKKNSINLIIKYFIIIIKFITAETLLKT